MLDWLKKNKRFIKIRAIEQELNMPDSTLIKAVNEVQSLPKKWQEPVNNFINKLRNE
jgi:fructose-1,6-bisphosphatase